LEARSKDNMRENTQEFIINLIVIIAVAAGIFMFFFGMGYIILHSEPNIEEMYNKCIDNCKQIFQEQKLIDCLGMCNNLIVNNQTRGSIGGNG